MDQEEFDSLADGSWKYEIERLQDLVRWAYSKLHGRTFTNMDDALKLDEMKMRLEHGA